MDQILTADRVLPGPVDAPALTCSILVRDDRIHSLGPVEVLREQAHDGHKELALPGCSIVPGLINAHLHLAADLTSSPFDTVQTGSRAEIETVMEENALAALRGGCTTVRDLGDRFGMAFELRDRIAAGTLVGPRILAAGSPLTVPNGHCWFLDGVVQGRQQIRAKIDELAEKGSDVIKVMAGGGQMTPGGASQWESQFSPAELRFIVEHAASRGLPVAAHAHATPTIIECIHAGVTTIEHCGWRSGPAQVDRPEEAVRAMAGRGVIAGDTTPPQWRRMAERMQLPDGHRFGDQVRWMDDHGVSIIIGTDSGMPNAVFDQYVNSLELYEELGFTPAQVLEKATSGAAQLLGIGDETGRVATGLSADLLVVDGDPTANLQALRQVRLVMARGRTAPPASVSPAAG